MQLFSEIDSKPGLKSASELDLDSQVKTFWSCFEGSIKGNEGQRRILSIIADFTYVKLKEQLNVSNNLYIMPEFMHDYMGKEGKF